MGKRGQALVEYVLIIALISVLTISIVSYFGGYLKDAITKSSCSIADKIYMLENAIYSILSPEGFASILYKDSSKCKEAAENMKLTSYDLKELGVIDEIIKEPKKGIENDFEKVVHQLKKKILQNIAEIEKMKPTEMLEKRYEKYRKIGNTSD